MGWANRITAIRGILTLVVWVLLAIAAHRPSVPLLWTAFVVFVIAASTDFLDGMLARKFGDESVFGRIADPLVDKMLIIGTLILLLGVPLVGNILAAWMVALVLLRELVVTALRAAVEAQGKNFSAVPIGKWKMILQCITVGGLILYATGKTWAHSEVPFLNVLPNDQPYWSVCQALVWATLIVTVLSLIPYASRARTLLRAEPTS